MAGALDLSMKSRQRLGAALGATSVLLLVGAARTRPTDADLARAAIVNIGWVLLCAIGLSRRPPALGRVLIACTAVFDGAAAIVQWRLRSGQQS